MDNAIVITGAGCRFAGTAGAEAFWRHTLANETLLSPFPGAHELLAKAEAIGQPWLRPPRRVGLLGALYSHDPDALDLPADAEPFSPDAFFAAQLAVEALRDAGLSPRAPAPGRAGVYIGYANPFSPAMETVLQHLHGVDQTVALARNLSPHADEAQLASLSRHLRAALPKFSRAAAQNAHPHALAAEVSALLGFAGPARIACDGHVAFMAALRAAVDDLGAERADTAVVGALSPPFTAATLLAACALLETTRHEVPHALCRTADGTAPGEGAAFFVLQRAAPQSAFKSAPYAEVRAVALASGAAAEDRALGAALREAGAEPAAFGYVETHGSGVAREDNAELDALCRAFDPVGRLAAPVAVGTAKPMFGHTLAASGAAGFLRAALALRQRVVPPSVVAAKPHVCLARPRAPLHLPEEPRPWVAGAASRLAGVTAMDPAGLCANVVLRERHA